METFGFFGEIKCVKAGWQHASQSEQHARAPVSPRVFDTPSLCVASGSASILLARTGMLPVCSQKGPKKATRSRTTSRLERFVIRASSFLRHSSFELRHFS